MKRTLSFIFPPALAFAGVIVCCAILWNQTARFKRSVEKIAEDVRVSLIDLSGKVVYDSAGNDLPNHADRTEFEAVCADGLPRSVIRESETLRISMFYFAWRIGDYVLRIAVPYQAVTDAKSDAVRGLIAAVGTGALIVAALFFLIMAAFTMALSAARYGERAGIQRTLKITLPENVDYEGLFDDLFEKYTRRHELVKVRTSNMGTLYELSYQIELKDLNHSREFIDAIRCRNGNLNISCGHDEDRELM